MQTCPELPFPVLFRNHFFLAVNKPAGIPVIPGRQPDAPSVKSLLETSLGQRLFTVHRLDRDTTGALLFAFTASSHRSLSIAFEKGQVRKTYLALVEGQLRSPVDVSVALMPARRNRMRAVRGDEAGKAALTQIVPREIFSSVTLVEAFPVTGRTHQIRVHLQAMGHPLCVDPQYGRPDSRWHLTRTPLHALKLTIPGAGIGLGAEPEIQIEAPLPEDFAQALALLRA